MKVKCFDTPAGKFFILLNGEPIEFCVEPGTYNTFYIDEKELHPLGCYEVSLDISSLSAGDVVIFAYEFGNLAYDGGDEHTLNIVGEINGYIVGMGAIDTDDYESPTNDQENYFPFENYGKTKSGFEFHILDNPRKYIAHPMQRILNIPIVWESSDNKYAWELVSFLTC